VKTKVLHLLCPATDATPPEAQVDGDCGHKCAASQKTLDMLATPDEHAIYCLACFTSIPTKGV
jgi:hypothetical protein